MQVVVPDQPPPGTAKLNPEVAVTELTPEQVEMMAQLEHRRFTIERELVESRHGFAYRKDSHPVPWDKESEKNRNWNREECARLPGIMARLGMELHPVRTIRLYGEQLPAAVQELEQFIAAPGRAHCSLIVDLDDKEAVHAAQSSLSLPSQSLGIWLFSHREPQEFFDHKLRDKASEQDAIERNALIRRANGWAPRVRIKQEA